MKFLFHKIFLSPVCFGNRDYKIPTYNAYNNKDKKGRKFAQMVCDELGYGRHARFLGNQEEYLKFIKEHFEKNRHHAEEELFLKVSFLGK